MSPITSRDSSNKKRQAKYISKIPIMEAIIARIPAHQSAEGPFQLPMNIATGYGGTGKDLWAWALCDAPLIVYALARFGLGAEPSV